MGFIARHRLGWSLALFALALAALATVPSFPALPFYFDQALQRVLLSALVCGLMALLGGARALAPATTGLRSALRLGAYPVAVAAVLLAVELTGLLQLAAGSTPGSAWLALPADWAVDLAGMAALCAFVGVFEEVLFRGVLLGGLLSRFGGTRNGVVVAALVSSVVFGAVHVVSSAGATDALTLAQMLLKTVQAGSIGLISAAVYVRTRNIWGVAALHALADFLLMAPLALVGGGEAALGSYVSQGADALSVALGVALVAAYLFAVALYAPCAVQGWRLLEGSPLPSLGPLEPGWDPQEDAGEKNGAPVAPDGVRAPGGPVPPDGL